MNWLGGLQMESPSTASSATPTWLWVPPKPGHAVINLGDASVKFTNSVLKSGRHRVVPPPREQAGFARYSVVYFVRPEDDSRLRVLEGKGVPKEEDGEGEGVLAKEWIYQQTLKLGVRTD